MTAPQPARTQPSPTVLNSEDYDISHKKSENDTTTVISHVLTHDPSSLKQNIQAQAKIVPTPIIRVTGSHKGVRASVWDGNAVSIDVVDFDFTIPIKDLFPETWRELKVVPNGWATHRGTETKSYSPPGLDVEASVAVPSLDDWCLGFCRAKNCLKEYVTTLCS